ncbi:MAG: FkbM family methyltransferase [Haliea sp.]
MTNNPPNAFQRLLSEYLAHSLLKRARGYRRTHPQMAIFAHDFIGTEINVYGRYEHRELMALSGLIAGLDRSKRVLDVGANIGNHTLYFVGEGFEHIHAFEPNPRTLRLLQFNTESHPQVTVHDFGLSEQDATLEAVIPLVNAGGSSLEAGHQEAHSADAERISFDVKRFDDLPLAQEPVSLVKIDVEGHEPKAIAGMMEMLWRDRPLVVFECNRKTERFSAVRLVAMLQEAGYSSFAAIEAPASAIPQTLPSLLRRPLRLLERLVSTRQAHCKITQISDFEERNYPMVVASQSIGN